MEGFPNKSRHISLEEIDEILSATEFETKVIQGYNEYNKGIGYETFRNALVHCLREARSAAEIKGAISYSDAFSQGFQEGQTDAWLTRDYEESSSGRLLKLKKIREQGL